MGSIEDQRIIDLTSRNQAEFFDGADIAFEVTAPIRAEYRAIHGVEDLSPGFKEVLRDLAVINAHISGQLGNLSDEQLEAKRFGAKLAANLVLGLPKEVET